MTNKSEVLDWAEDEVMTFSFGNLFPPNMRFFGYAILLFGLVGATESIWALPICWLIGGWLSFRKSGIQIKPKEKLRREYTSFLIKCGKWSSYEDYPDMAVLRGREGFTAYSRAMVELNASEMVYDIYLLSSDHRKRLIVARSEDAAGAEEKGKSIAKALGVNWTIYSPVVSEQTRRRLR